MLLDRFRLWSLPESQLREQVTIENAALISQFLGKRPIVLLCPHFLGLEAAGQRITLEFSVMSLYRPCKSEAFETFRSRARQRFGRQHLYPTDGNLLPMIRRLRSGTPLFLLPDLDCGAPGAVFAPFFGVQAATAPLAAWCSLRIDAVLLPISVKRVHEGRYNVIVHEPLPKLHTDLAEATGQVNLVIEQMVSADPAQYWWGQPRFATRPPGDASFYSEAVLREAREAFGSAV